MKSLNIGGAASAMTHLATHLAFRMRGGKNALACPWPDFKSPVFATGERLIGAHTEKFGTSYRSTRPRQIAHGQLK